MARSERPKRLEDRLDAALDGIGVGTVATELAPLLRAAGELRAACARMELAPEAARGHIAKALGAAEVAEVSGIAVAPRSTPRRRWRRRGATFALAAALVLTPLVALSTATLPGEPLYPVKLTVENARLTAARWSSDRTVDERTRIARSRLAELHQLVASGRTDRIASAISTLDGAVNAAQRAAGTVNGLQDPARLAALNGRLGNLRAGRTAELTSLVRRLPSTTPVAARVEIEGAVERSLARTDGAVASR